MGKKIELEINFVLGKICELEKKLKWEKNVRSKICEMRKICQVGK